MFTLPAGCQKNLGSDDWSSQDESEESEDEMEAKEINIKLTGQPKKHKKGGG